MAMQQDRSQPPCLAFATALFFTCALAWNISIGNLSTLLCGFTGVLIATLFWITYGQDFTERIALLLCLSITLATGKVSWTILPGNWFVLISSVISVAVFSYLLLRRYLRSVVEVFWAHSLFGGIQVSQIAIWRALLYTQAPLTASLVWRIIIEKLGRDRSIEAVKMLAGAATGHPDPSARLYALRTLYRFTDQERIDTICAAWAATRHLDLAELLIRHQWRASTATTPQTFVLSTLLLGELDSLRASKAEWIPSLAQAALDTDPLIAGRALQVLQGLEDVKAREALCRLVIEEENHQLQAAVLATGYLPRDEKERALFLFMTGQWERYASHDFDRRLMHSAYLSSPEPVRRRIREKLHTVGRRDFLPIISGESSEESIPQFSAGESEILVQTLIDNRDWAALWMRVFDLPFQWSVRAMETLSKTSWRPVDEEGRTVFDKLAALVTNGIPREPSELQNLFPLIIKRATVHVPGRLNTIAFAPVQPVLAIGTGQGKVILWNYQTVKRELVLSHFVDSISEVTFCSNGTLLCTQRANLGEASSINVFEYPWNESPFFLGPHMGAVTGLAPLGNSRVLSAWDDGTVILWDIPTRQEICRREVLPPAYNLRVSPDETQFLALHQWLDVFSLPDLQNRTSARDDTSFNCATFAPDSQSLFASRSSGQLLIYKKSPTQSNLLTAEKEPLTEYAPFKQVEAIEILKRLSLVMSADTRGEIRFFSIDQHQSLGSFLVPNGQITSLAISPDEFFMAIVSDRETLTLWDLRPLVAHVLLDRPFAQAETRIMPPLHAVLSDPHLSLRARQVLQFAQFILNHRFRYAIEIGETPSIAMGEFDIEIE